MNRLKTLTPKSPKATVSANLASVSSGVSITGNVSPRRLRLLPSGYEKNYAYPLLVWLHGGGDDEKQLLRVMRHVSLQNYIGVAPRGIGSEGGRRDGRVFWPQSEAGIQYALEAVSGVIRTTKEEYTIAAHRVFLAGYADGGTMALRIAFSYPQYFAGVVSLNGMLPRGNQPLRSIERIRQLPIFLGYGEESILYPMDRVTEDLRVLHALGATAMVRQYPCDDCPTTVMLGDVNRWLMDCVTGATRTGRDRANSRESLN